MLIDRPQVVEGSFISNTTVQQGTAFPTTVNIGELFYLTAPINGTTPAGLYSFGTTSSWDNVIAPGLSTYNHINDSTKHLTPTQNTLLDGLSASLTAAELNYVIGVTSPLQTQLNTLSSHVANTSIHVTSAQKTLLNGLSGSLTSGELNYVVGVVGPIQPQINSLSAYNTIQDGRLTSLEDTSTSQTQLDLNAHVANVAVHLSASQNTLLDNLEANGITAADINKLGGAAALPASITTTLAGLESNKLARAGGSITGNISFSGGRITGLQSPIAIDEPATKDYVDSFVLGLHWLAAAKAATTGNITLSGLQTIDNVVLAAGDRVLVKDQTLPATNGVYDAAVGAWTRSSDSNSPVKIESAEIFVQDHATATQAKSTWIQTAKGVTLGTTPLVFSPFSTPGVNSAGSGLDLASNGNITVKQGAGITFDANSTVVLDLYSGGGLMLTTNNTAAAALTTTAAQLALAPTGVTAGTYSSGATTMNSFTVDAKGRITSVGSNTVIAPAFTSITGLPTTLSGYGITNAVTKSGDTMTGTLNFSGGTIIANSSPAANAAWLTTAAYATGQGDNRTHFGFSYAGNMWNFLRGHTTQIEGNVIVGGTLTVNGYAALTSNTLNNLSQLTNGPGFITTAGVTWTNLSGKPTRSTWSGSTLVASELGWSNYQNGHTVFDASSGLTPIGTSCGNTHPVNGWVPTYPTLMGFNGTDTYGVRVDRSRVSDITDQRVFSNIVTNGVARGSYGSVSVTSSNNGYSGIDFTAASTTLMVGTDGTTGMFKNNSTWLWYFDGAGVLTDGIVPASRITGTVPSATLATKASTLGRGGDGVAMTFNYAGQGGQPSWLWGTQNGVDTNVYNPANFSVNYATSASTVPWSGVTGKPTLYYNLGTTGAASPNPDTFPAQTLAVIDGFSTSDLGMYQIGIMAVGAGAGTRALQLVANWDTEEAAPSGLRFRTNDDTGNTSAWSALRTVWDTGNLTSLSQLSNNTGFITSSSLTGYLQRNVDIWQTSTDGYNRLYFAAGARSYYSSNAGHEFRNNGGTQTFLIDNSGNCTAAGDITAFSDRKLKTDIHQILSPLEKVEQLKGVTFTRLDTGARGTGLIAQDVQAVLPEAVHESDGTLAVAYGNLVGLLVESIKELNSELKALRAEVQELKAK